MIAIIRLIAKFVRVLVRLPREQRLAILTKPDGQVEFFLRLSAGDFSGEIEWGRLNTSLGEGGLALDLDVKPSTSPRPPTVILGLHWH
jgi:hypothetical protein